ncbi:MAG: hypothetical protein IIX32_03350, partial [Alistipes sp.]|nr:hypothetical protein [Alistipes sp.]
MENLNLISNFAEFKELKNIDKATMIGVLEDVFRHALQKQFESDENFDVIINPEKGDLEIWRNREVVEDDAVENPNTQIAVSEVKAIDSSYEVSRIWHPSFRGCARISAWWASVRYSARCRMSPHPHRAFP